MEKGIRHISKSYLATVPETITYKRNTQTPMRTLTHNYLWLDRSRVRYGTRVTSTGSNTIEKSSGDFFESYLYTGDTSINKTLTCTVILSIRRRGEGWTH